jgi:hypothetical protein
MLSIVGALRRNLFPDGLVKSLKMLFSVISESFDVKSLDSR